METATTPAIGPVREHLEGFQKRVCSALEEQDDSSKFRVEEIARDGGGHSRPCVLEGGDVIDKAAVNFSHTRGVNLPPAATERRPELVGGQYEAVSVSLIVHPRNPYAPTSHANYRCFVASKEGIEPVWWFGGGFDLTPYYGFAEDVVEWHRIARDACAGFAPDLYDRCKRACDEYFTLPHRGEARGVGGLFFDDFDEGGFDASFAFVRAASDAYLAAYVPILAKRKDTSYGEREREWQLYRRGRYVEFNLLYDRGTRFGLQAGARTESVLASLPPVVHWQYDYRPEPGSPEAALAEEFLAPRDWLAGE